MFIPSHSSAVSEGIAFGRWLSQDNDSSKDKLKQWSSFIGIVTAIVGNILISFALNLQRYAHIRIDREYTESQTAWKKEHQNASSHGRGYGTTQQEQSVDRTREQIESHHVSKNGYTTIREHEANTSQKKLRDEEAQQMDERRSSQDSMHSDSTLTSESDHNSRKSYLRSPYWWVGIILMTIGETGNFLAYGFAPASIVSPLGVVALISNCIIAPLILKERFRGRDFLGVLIAVAGAVVVVLSAKTSESKMGPDMLWANIKRWEFLVYVLLTAAALLTLMWASNKYGEKSILIDLGIVGLFGGYTALATKGVASLVSDTLWRALTFPITYVCIVVLVGSALSQIRYINRALQRFDSTQVIPTQFVLFTLSVIIGSAVLYRDFESATADRVGKFIGGCFLTFLGVYFITSKRVSDDTDENSSPASSPERMRLLNNPADEEHPRLSRLRTSSSAAHKKPYLHTETPSSFEGRRKRSPQPLVTSPPTVASDKKKELPQPPQLTETRQPRRRTSLSTAGSLSPSSDSTHSPIPPPSPFANAKKTPYPLSATLNPWLSSTDRLVETPLSHHPNNSNLPTPYRPSPQSSLPRISGPNSRLRSTQSSMDVQPSTPLSRTSLPNVLLRSPSGPAAPETPVNAADKSRGGSPPKALESTPPPKLMARKSISRLMPGPLLSPLSGGLSAVVADSLRRGEGSIRSLPRRHRSPGPTRKPLVRGSVSDEVISRPGFGSREESGIADDEREDDESEGDSDGVEDRDRVGRRRLRSMSGTFGGLISRGKGGGSSRRRRKKKRRAPGEETSREREQAES